MSIVYLVAGGTAGHINAALSLGELFKEKNWDVRYISGTRFLDKKLFPAGQTKFLESRALRTKNPLVLFKNLTLNVLSFISMLILYLKNRPKLIIGAGGYVCGPTLLAGWMLGIPVYIIEQNAIAGLTNRILQKISKKVFTHFKNTKGIEPKKVFVSGNPVRSQIKFNPNHPIANPVKILVFGGSLGATQINEAISELVKMETDLNMHIVHQVGKDNLTDVTNNPKVLYEQFEYIDNMNEYYDWTDIVVARAGASTISELRIIKKPAILIPYPAATDNHQFYNACELRDEENFPVYVLDQKLKKVELAQEVEKYIRISTANFNVEKKLESVAPANASELIFNEVTKYVRN